MKNGGISKFINNPLGAVAPTVDSVELRIDSPMRSIAFRARISAPCGAVRHAGSTDILGWKIWPNFMGKIWKDGNGWKWMEMDGNGWKWMGKKTWQKKYQTSIKMSHYDKRVRGLVTEGVHGNGRILTWGSLWTRDLDQQNMAQNLGINRGNVVTPPIDLTALTFVTPSPTW